MAYTNAADPLVCVISELLLIGRSLHWSTAWAQATLVVVGSEGLENVIFS